MESMKDFMREGESNKPHRAFTADDLKQISMGTKVEMEHTKDPVVAKKIAKDHVSEHPTVHGKPGYYDELEGMEEKLEEIAKKAFYNELQKIGAASASRTFETAL